MEIKDLSRYRGKGEVLPVADIKKMVELEDERSEKIYTGISFLDETLNFFRLGEIAVVSGPPGHGKTTFCRFLITEFSNLGYKVLYLGKEGGIGNFFNKFHGKLPSFYMSNEFISSTIGWYEDRVLEAKQKFGCNIVFVDHLHYILDMVQMRKSDTSMFIGIFMRQLVDLCMKYNVLLFLVCHTTKQVFAKAPNMGDLRDSSFIAQESDYVFMIYRTTKIDTLNGEIEYIGNKCKLSIQKNRREGILKNFNLVYSYGEFKEDFGEKRGSDITNM